jgi:hypothetical protein
LFACYFSFSCVSSHYDQLLLKAIKSRRLTWPKHVGTHGIDEIMHKGFGVDLGYLMVARLPLDPRFVVLKLGPGRWIFKVDKSPLHDFLGKGVKPPIPCRMILRHVKESYGYERDTL